MDIKYRTPFHLTGEVCDLDAAQEYLTEDDMTSYLVDDLADESQYGYFKPSLAHLKDKVKHIEWHLTSENEGYIELITSEEIPQSELDQISEWVSGQCSDGLGEGFEQQEFACWTEEDYDDPRWDEYYHEWTNETTVMCSFDWKTNKYIFSRYEA